MNDKLEQWLMGTNTKKRKRAEISGAGYTEHQELHHNLDCMNSIKKLKTERDDLAQKCEILKTVEETLKELKRNGYLDENGLPLKKK